MSTGKRWAWLPARRILLLSLAGALGILFGTGAYTFGYAKGFSYFSTDPSACANCHIMQPQFDAWQRSSHKASAVCIDCHLPSAFFSKYFEKAENGYRHAAKFTTESFVEPIVLQPRATAILQANCVRCHEAMVAGLPGLQATHASATLCVHCHASVGHGDAARLGGPYRDAELQFEPQP